MSTPKNDTLRNAQTLVSKTCFKYNLPIADVWETVKEDYSDSDISQITEQDILNIANAL